MAMAAKNAVANSANHGNDDSGTVDRDAMRETFRLLPREMLVAHVEVAQEVLRELSTSSSAAASGRA